MADTVVVVVVELVEKEAFGLETSPGSRSTIAATAAPAASRSKATAMTLRRMKFGDDPFDTANDRSGGHNGSMEISELQQLAVERASEDARVRELQSLLGTSGSVHIVGGAVRDFALGYAPTEIDLVAEEDAREIAAVCGGADVEVHDTFLTASFTLASGSVDVATARTESYSRPGALPSVFPARIEEDRSRRDFTVNGLLIRLSDLKVVEDATGWGDLAGGVLRVLHDESFIDDPTRLWRLARYAGRLGFSADGHTQELALEAIEGEAQSSISKARIGAELARTIHQRETDAPILGACRLGLLGDGVDHEQVAAVLGAVEALGLEVYESDEVRLAAIAWGGGSPLLSIRKELELGDALTTVLSDAESGPELISALSAAARPSEVDALCQGVNPAVLAVAGALAEDSKPLLQWLNRTSKLSIPFSGADLVAAGVPEGPLVGVGLGIARAHMLDTGIEDREALLAIALEAAGSQT